MQEIESELKIIKRWAENHPLVKKAYFYGSRFKGNYGENSDIDIAIELNLGHNDKKPMDTWFGESADMKTELQSVLRYQLDLQWYVNESETPDMHAYLNEASIVIYE